MKLFSFLAVALFMTANAFAAKQIPVTLKEAGKSYQGNLFVPAEAKGSLPLVIVVHEWWGKTDYSLKRAAQVADELGYAALAVDLYGEGKTVDNPKDAMAMSGPFYKDPSIGVKRLVEFVPAAMSAAKKAKIALDPSKVAAIGYCFGGTQVLNLARAGGLSGNEKLLGVATFHGGLESSLKASAPIKTKLLVMTGAADPMVDAQQVANFKDEMKKAQADLNLISYPGAKHAFTNPAATELGKKFNIPVEYNAAADADSWKQLKGFLSSLFGK